MLAGTTLHVRWPGLLFSPLGFLHCWSKLRAGRVRLVGVGAQIALHAGIHPNSIVHVEQQPPPKPAEDFCDKATLIALIQEMRDLANLMEVVRPGPRRPSKVYTLGNLIGILEEELPNHGPLSQVDIDRLARCMGIGDWCLQQLHQLRVERGCTYLHVQRARAAEAGS